MIIPNYQREEVNRALLRIIRVNSVSGLYNEFYDPSPLSPTIDGDFFDMNDLFWQHVLSENNLSKTMLQLSREIGKQLQNDIKAQVVLNNPDRFIERVEKSKISVCDQCQSQEEFFSDLEILSIACHIISLSTVPFELSLNEGFLRSSFSSEEMSDNCLSLYSNPYLTFVVEEAFPRLCDINPDIVYFMGRPNIASFALAKMVREWKRSAFLCISNHSSEYYSLNKVENFLQNNKPLFRVFDCVTLDDRDETINAISDALESNQPIERVSGILYSKHSSGHLDIVRTRGSVNDTTSHTSFRYASKDLDFVTSPNSLANVKLFPQTACYWNKCTFCGINSKYARGIDGWNIDQAVRIIKSVKRAGCDYFWAIDEAIPPHILVDVARNMKSNDIALHWQARSRIDSGFIGSNAFRMLADAGLREIRLGFESASKRILNLMNKTDEDDYLELAASIVSGFFDVGVRVHFPVIIGFPTESRFDRQKTYQYLEALRTKYSNFSYNINIFHLDVTSIVYQQWEKYGITQLKYPCDPSNFLGNTIDWDSIAFPISIDVLEQDQNRIMRKQYPWIPENALMKPHIFYRLWETSRKSLTSEHHPQKEISDSCVDSSSVIILSPNTDIVEGFMIGESINTIMYNWDTHHVVLGDETLSRTVNSFGSISNSGELLSRATNHSVQPNPPMQLIHDLVRLGLAKEMTANESNDKNN